MTDQLQIPPREQLVLRSVGHLDGQTAIKQFVPIRGVRTCVL
eukprot:CAMPEP_0180318138 /NCGR_PEP_ID=MMETSP0988-20121125/34251_1 /TAXON_ID=697907 /ORGANISM="non described non described, Strain CCMP2293" /LENGTH=41 /DNA_ID= /DNA_START= /DNA_END= /DNA_ORIENTATION=